MQKASRRRSVAARSGAGDDQLEHQAVTDPVESVRADLRRLCVWSGLPGRAVISGYVYDVDTGLVAPVEADRTTVDR